MLQNEVKKGADHVVGMKEEVGYIDVSQTKITTNLLGFVCLLCDPRVGGIHMGLKQLVLPEGGRADSTLVGKVGGFEGLVVVLGHVVQQLPLVNLKI